MRIMSNLPIVIAQRSSLEFLDLHTNLLTGHDSWIPTDSREVLPTFGFDTTASQRLEALGLSQPVEVFVPRTAGMRHPPGVRLRGHARPLVREDLVRITDDIYACVPELSLAGAITGQSAPRAATLIDQFVSSYRIVPPQAMLNYLATFPDSHAHVMTDEYGESLTSVTMYGLDPLTTLEQLKRYAMARSHIRGIDLLRDALPLCEEGLRSPLETEDHLLLFGPRHLGGIGLPRPRVNAPQALSRKAREIIDRHTLTPDFYWPDQRLVVEVLGASDHEGSEARIADTSEREHVWRAMGNDVMTHTAREIERLSSFTPMARELAAKIGVRYRTDVRMFAVRQAWLRAEVAPPVDGVVGKSLRSWREMLADERYDDLVDER